MEIGQGAVRSASHRCWHLEVELVHDIVLERAKEHIERGTWDEWWKSRDDLIEIIIG